MTISPRQAIELSVAQLVDALKRHTETVSGMRGGSSEIPALFNASIEVDQLLAVWNARVFDHTGIYPVSLEDPGQESGEESVDNEDEPAEPIDGEPLTVVSRWDLEIVDAEALMQAGRAAHQRLQPDENDADAEVAVPTAGQAMYTPLHEQGEPWYDLPGVVVLRGARCYVRPDETPEPLSETNFDDPITEPPGDRLYSESWM